MERWDQLFSIWESGGERDDSRAAIVMNELDKVSPTRWCLEIEWKSRFIPVPLDRPGSDRSIHT